jgi:DNA polymerase I-like protein with 3'-5' exonuclease and polymerase domains
VVEVARTASVKSKHKSIGGIQLPLFEPASEWTLPTEFPDLKDAKYIGVDVEADDPNLKARGPGYLRGDAKVVGISLATEYGFKIYLPFGHILGDNLPKQKVVDYVKYQLKWAHQVKVGANLGYELEALDSLDIPIVGKLYDIQIAEPLLDEEKEGGYSLEQLSWDYLGYGKSEELLKKAATEYGLDPKRDLHKLPAKFAGVYGEDDAYNPIEIMQQQEERIYNEGLTQVLELEQNLQPIIWKMRKRGIAVDLDRAEQLSKLMLADENVLLSDLREISQLNVDPWSSKSLYIAFEKLGLQSYVTYTAPTKQYPNGQPSFTSDFLKEMSGKHLFCKKLHNLRTASKMRNDFVEGLVLGFNVKGRLHPQWHQLRADDEDRENGTTTGRIASSKPNLTQIPVRDPKWGKMVRTMFIPDKGGRYCKNDYSQQEPRGMLHFAYIKGYEGAAEVRQRYIDDPTISYHRIVEEIIQLKTGRALDPDPDTSYRIAKDINLGSAYGMGKDKLARKLRIPVEQASELLRVFHAGVPYVKKLEEHCMNLVRANGFIRTILGRKRRFELWEPTDWDKKRGVIPIKDYENAVLLWGDVQRAYIHKALNAKVQGTAADQTKSAIIQLDAEGLTPQIQVYDELGTTIWSDEEAFRIQKIMENAIPEFTVPHEASPDVGLSWGEVKPLLRSH